MTIYIKARLTIKLSDFKMLLLLIFILAADIATKYVVQNRMLLYQSYSVIPNFLNITYVENPGAAFGILAGVNSFWRNILLGGISAIAIFMLIMFYRKCAQENDKIKLALVLILSGAIGNIIDRIRFGVVIDFIDAHIYQYHWPAFNVADSVICIGVGLLFWVFWVEGVPE